MELTELSNDILFSLAIQLDLDDLLRFCLSSKKINDAICNKDNVWLYKLNKEFPNWQELKGDLNIKNPITLFPIIEAKSLKDIYVTLYYWNIFTVLKKKLKIENDIYKIYTLKMSFLGNTELIEIPKQIGKLINLRELYLGRNKLKEIPKEIGKLINLEVLGLNHNELTTIPIETKNLKKLRVLNLSYNKLTKLPKEIALLTNLKELYLSSEQMKLIPVEITNVKHISIIII